MKQYPYVEDYLEILAGYLPENKGAVSMLGYSFMNPKRIISLARYDVKIVDSMAQHVLGGGALTDRQANLSISLILKYRKQFSKNDIDITPVETPVFRTPIREVVRLKQMSIEGNAIQVKFPYTKTLIDGLYEYKKTSIGSVEYYSDERVWKFGLTEHNVTWACTWGALNGFEISEDLTELFKQILDCEQTVYEIKLVKADTGDFMITNAPRSLVEYIDTHLGGFGRDNVAKLVDYSGVLGYTVDSNISASPSIKFYGSGFKHRLDPSAENLLSVLDYAIEVQRFPIMIYHPAGAIGNSIDVEIIHELFNDDEILHIDITGKISTSNVDINDAKIIYVEKFPKVPLISKIPLMVTYQELLYGSSKQSWLTSAERIIYLCHSTLRK